MNQSVAELLRGKKTYLVAVAAAVYGLGLGLGWWPRQEWLEPMLYGSGVATLRAGVQRAESAAEGGLP